MHLMDKTPDSNIQNLILNMIKKSAGNLNTHLTILLERLKKINSVLLAHSFEVQVSKCFSSFAIYINYLLSPVGK